MSKATLCVFCDRDALRRAEVYFENDLAIYASTRDPRDPPDVLPGCGIVVPIAHKPSPFDLTEAEWLATRELLLKAKARVGRAPRTRRICRGLELRAGSGPRPPARAAALRR